MKPGPRNLVTDVEGLLVGNVEDVSVRTGVTVILATAPVVGGVDIRGGAPGTTGTAELEPTRVVEKVDALVRSGGSGFGVAAAAGVQSWLAEHGRGFPVGPVRVPIVPGAILFDLLNGGDKNWGEEPPYRMLARQACDTASIDFELGNSGAGYGATAGDLKGGLGSASLRADGGWTVGAIVAVNSHGSVTIPNTSTLWAWPLEIGGEMGGQPIPNGPVAVTDLDYVFGSERGRNTTIGAIATDVALTQVQATRVAAMAHDGFARAIRPVHTMFDGDTIFTISTGKYELPEPAHASVSRLGMLAADCMVRAIGRAIFSAGSLGDAPGYREINGAAFARS
ncbi:MAG: P1 family peptidase [Proteobacteria bacterium]|nr:P1 family peptidase [Pseudomonadota bacterium]